MDRLQSANLNTPAEYARIFRARSEREPDWADVRRWGTLLSRFHGGRLIDLGCLDSQVAPDAARMSGTSVVGLDFVPEVIDRNRQLYPEVLWMRGDVYDTGFADGSFDYAVLGEVLEHLERPGEAIAEAMRLLRPGGILALSTPLEEAKEPGAVDGERHLWSFSETDLRDILEPYGTVEIKILRSQQEPEYRYCWPQLIAFTQKRL